MIKENILEAVEEVIERGKYNVKKKRTLAHWASYLSLV